MYEIRGKVMYKAHIPNIHALNSDTHTLFFSILILNSQCVGVAKEVNNKRAPGLIYLPWYFDRRNALSHTLALKDFRNDFVFRFGHAKSLSIRHGIFQYFGPRNFFHSNRRSE